MPITHNPLNQNELWDKILKEGEESFDFRSYRECYRSREWKFSFEAWRRQETMEAFDGEEEVDF